MLNELENSPPHKKAYVRTYGCQMNEQDSSQMQILLGELGYGRAFDEFEADLILINTCSIREKAVHKIYSDLGRLRSLKEHNPHLILGISGCVAEQEKSSLTKRFPFLDLVFGPDHIRKLPQMLSELDEKRSQSPLKAQLVHTGFDLRKDFQFVNIAPASEENRIKAFVNIQKGCDNICSFCIVPFVRGREVSRPFEDIIQEIHQLVDQGVKEVTLLGQNVNSYGLKNPNFKTFAQLLNGIAKETKLQRLRFTTSHPKDVKEDLIEEYKNNPILETHFHLPVQSGSTKILNAMRRQYSREDYLKIIEDLKNLNRNIGLSTDIIVGFPGETESDFLETMSLVKEVRFDMSFSFVYSARPYTKAVHLEDTVPYAEKLERLKVLQDECRLISKDQNSKEVGQTHEVLVEEIDGENLDQIKSRTASNKIVHFTAPNLQSGQFVKVKVNKAQAHSLIGEKV